VTQAQPTLRLVLIERNKKITSGVLLCGCLLAVICVAMLPAGFLDAFGYAGTFASFGFVVVYFALCVVAPWLRFNTT
jgi:hypothetical protein